MGLHFCRFGSFAARAREAEVYPVLGYTDVPTREALPKNTVTIRDGIHLHAHARGAASSENAILRFDLLSTPRAHYRLFVQSTRTIKINIFRERVGTQVFPHSDFREGGGGYAMTCRRCCRCSSMLASSAPCLPYRISFHAAPRGGVRLHPLCPRVRPLNNESFPSFPPWPAAERSATQGRIALEFPAVACCRVPPSVAALLSLSGLHRRPSVKT